MALQLLHTMDFPTSKWTQVDCMTLIRVSWLNSRAVAICLLYNREDRNCSLKISIITKVNLHIQEPLVCATNLSLPVRECREGKGKECKKSPVSEEYKWWWKRENKRKEKEVKTKVMRIDSSMWVSFGSREVRIRE